MPQKFEIEFPDLKQAMFNLQEALLSGLPKIKISGAGLAGAFQRGRLGVDQKLIDITKELIKRKEYARAREIARQAALQAQIEGKPENVQLAKGLLLAIMIAEQSELREKGER